MKYAAALVPATLVLAGLCLLPALPAADTKPVKPTNLSINTDDDEDDPFISSNNLVLYYAAKGAEKWDIMVSRRPSPTAPWRKGEILQDYIRTEVDDRSVCATVEGRFPQFLYFASKTDKASKNFDIYVAIKNGRDKAFTEPRALTTVDTPDADEMHPWLAGDGKELYFSRKTKEGWRVFVAKRPNATGPLGFGEPALLEDLPPGFHHATLTADGKTMYLQGPLQPGRWGLFTATRTTKGWTAPEALDMLNDPEASTGDRSPALSRDGKQLYFSSDRDGGKGGRDLYMVETAALKKK